MNDFTLEAYGGYLQAIQSSYPNILRFDEYFQADPEPEGFCLIRHDVDRRPGKALRMALLETRLGVRSTYFFRTKPHTFSPDIIQKIHHLGHEVGYHYESLSDTKGDMDEALRDFEMNLAKLREIGPVRTIAMHGRPFRPYDNRLLWRDPANHKRLVDELGVLGEVYLDIDYSDIAYINDTGRNWSSTQANLRDRIEPALSRDFAGRRQLTEYLRTHPDPKLVFQVHPERWAATFADYAISLCFDLAVNTGKKVVRAIGR